MHRAAASAALVLALVVAAPAGAKELSAARACDADRCNTVTSHGRVAALMDQRPAAAPERSAPFHRVRFTVNDPDGSDVHFTVAYVPALGLVRERPSMNGETLWAKPSRRAIRAFDRLTRGLEPIPAKRLRGVAAARTSAAAPSPRSGDAAAPSPRSGGGATWWLVLVAPAVAAVVWAARRRHGVRRIFTAPSSFF